LRAKRGKLLPFNGDLCHPPRREQRCYEL